MAFNPFQVQSKISLRQVLIEQFRNLMDEIERVNDSALLTQMEKFNQALASYAPELTNYLLMKKSLIFHSGFEHLNLKPIWIWGILGQNKINDMNKVHEYAKTNGCFLFKSKPAPETLIVLKSEYWPEFNGFIVLLTDGTTKIVKY